MKAIITGHQGFIGKNLYKYLTKEKYPFEKGIKVGFRANSNLK